MNLRRPKFTVCGSFKTIKGEYLSSFWRFFDEEDDAQKCYQEHLEKGDNPVLRLFCPKKDLPYLGLANNAYLTLNNPF